MRLLVCGSREYTDTSEMHDTLDGIAEVLRVDCVIEGEQRGADLMAREWAEVRDVPVVPFPADWKRYGRKRAGPIRNKQMLVEGRPDLVVAFPLPGSVGTWDIMRQARERRVTVWIMPGDIALVQALGEGVFS